MGIPKLGIFAFLLLTIGSGSTWAENPGEESAKPKGNPRDQQMRIHETLSQVHRQAAQCLKSGASIDECNRRIRESCPVGKVEQCAVVDLTELEKHKTTHQMGGIAGKGPLQRDQGEASPVPSAP